MPSTALSTLNSMPSRAKPYTLKLRSPTPETSDPWGTGSWPISGIYPPAYSPKMLISYKHTFFVIVVFFLCPIMMMMMMMFTTSSAPSFLRQLFLLSCRRLYNQACPFADSPRVYIATNLSLTLMNALKIPENPNAPMQGSTIFLSPSSSVLSDPKP